MRTSVTKVFEFEAAHFLDGYPGDCNYVHGHSYKLEATFTGKKDNGMVVDFKKLKRIINEKIIKDIDHSFISSGKSGIKKTGSVTNEGTKVYNLFKRTTSEHIAERLFEEIEMAMKMSSENLINYPKLTKIKLWETSTSFVEVEAGYDD